MEFQRERRPKGESIRNTGYLAVAAGLALLLVYERLYRSGLKQYRN